MIYSLWLKNDNVLFWAWISLSYKAKKTVKSKKYKSGFHKLKVFAPILRSNLQCLTKTWIYLTPYVCTELIFDSRSSFTTKYFLKKLFTLLLAPFVSKLVNYSRQSYSLKNVWKPSKVLAKVQFFAKQLAFLGKSWKKSNA